MHIGGCFPARSCTCSGVCRGRLISPWRLGSFPLQLSSQSTHGGTAAAPRARATPLCAARPDRDRRTASDPHAASALPVSRTICLASPAVRPRCGEPTPSPTRANPPPPPCRPRHQQQSHPPASDALQCSAAEPKTCTTPPLPPSAVRSHPYDYPPLPPAPLPSPPKRQWGGHRRRGTWKRRTGSGPGKSSGTRPAPGTCRWPTRRP